MTRRVLLSVVACCLVLAACGTRVTEVTGATATSLVQRSTTPLGEAGGTEDPGAVDPTAPGDLGATGSDAVGGPDPGTEGPAGATTGGGSPAGPSGPATGEPIVLGAVGTKSGLVGAALMGGFRGLTVWERWVNAHGGIQGRPVRIIQVDDAGDPGKHAAAVRRLIREERVLAFIGNIAPFTLSAGIPQLEQAGVATIGGDGGDAAWFRSPIAFPINGQIVSRSRPAARWALANLPHRRAAVYFVSEADAPSVLAQNFVEEFTRGGGEVPINAGVSLATPDFTGEVVQAKNQGIELLFIVLEKAACNRFFDAARRQGYAPIIIAPACNAENGLAHRALTTDRLFLSSSARAPNLGGTSPAQQEATAAGRRFDPSLALDGAFMFGWMAGKLLEEAMAQPGAVLSSRGIIEALNQLPPTDLGGLTPTQSWPPGNHPEGRCGLISKFDGTGWELQTPEFLCA